MGLGLQGVGWGETLLGAGPWEVLGSTDPVLLHRLCGAGRTMGTTWMGTTGTTSWVTRRTT